MQTPKLVAVELPNSRFVVQLPRRGEDSPLRRGSRLLPRLRPELHQLRKQRAGTDDPDQRGQARQREQDHRRPEYEPERRQLGHSRDDEAGDHRPARQPPRQTRGERDAGKEEAERNNVPEAARRQRESRVRAATGSPRPGWPRNRTAKAGA